MNCNFLINTAALVLLFFVTNVASLEEETTLVEDMLETTASDLGDYLSITSTVSIMHEASSAVLITDAAAVAPVTVYNTSGNITTSSAASLLIIYVNLLVFVFSDIVCIMKTRDVG